MVFATSLNPGIPTFTTTGTVLLTPASVSSNCFCPPQHRLWGQQRSPSFRVTSSSSSSDSNAARGSDSLQLTQYMKDLDVVSLLKEGAEAEAAPLFLRDYKSMDAIYMNYGDAIYKSGDPSANEIVMSNTARVFDLLHLTDSFEFSSYHAAIRAPFDYYDFGHKYFRPLIDFKNSYVGNISIFQEILQKLHKGENVILMSNHQAEVDPVFIALLLESTHPFISENMTHFMNRGIPRINPFYKIFSMGRNLMQYHVPAAGEKGANQIIDDDEIVSLLRGGSQIIWIAPSGGMDCVDPLTQELSPAQFDCSVVVMMRELMERSGIPSHVYPLALLSTDRIISTNNSFAMLDDLESDPKDSFQDELKRTILNLKVRLSNYFSDEDMKKFDEMLTPPKRITQTEKPKEILDLPIQVEKDVEKALISFHGVGLSVGPMIDFHEATFDDPDEAKTVGSYNYTQRLYDSVNYQYKVLKSAIHEKQGLGASTHTVSLSQPFISHPSN